MIIWGKSQTFSGGASPLTVTFLEQNKETTEATGTVTFTSATLGTGTIIIALAHENTVSAITIDGTSASRMTDGVTNAISTVSTQTVEFWSASGITSATGDIVITRTAGADISTTTYLVEESFTVNDVTNSTIGNLATIPWVIDASVDTIASGHVLAAGISQRNSSGGAYEDSWDNPTGVTMDGSNTLYRINISDNLSFASGNGATSTTETPKTIELGSLTFYETRAAACAVALAPV